jgi:GTPase Era involved in 16S rRNA processing
MSQYQENIHIAILGPVSAGKSTFLNALLSNTYSDMMRKKTTMLPQIYQTTTNMKEIDTVEKIKEKNRSSNDEILNLRESNKYNESHFKELIYKVKPIDNFIELPDKKCTYGLCDMPGLNCSGGGDVMYYNYLEQNSHKIDVYILVFDINSALNTTDEVKILQEVNKYIQKNKHGYVHILVNKCDYVEFEDKNEFKFTDDELNDLYKRVREIVDKNINNLPNNQKVSISPICSSDLYIYRAAINNIESLDENQLDDIIKKECGKREFMKLQKEGIDKKRKFIKGLIKDKKTDINDWMKDTGYNLFCNYINKIMMNYQQIILYHIEQDVDKILADTKKSNNNFDETTNNLEIINQRFRNLITTNNNIKCKVEEIISQSIRTKLDKITQLMNDYIISGINTYSANTRENAESFLSKIGKFFTKVSNLFKTNPLASSEEKLKIKRIELINNNLAEKYNPEDFTELYTTKTIDLTRYTQCVANTLDKNFMTFDKLLESVKKITNNDEKFMNVIINKFTSSYKSDTKFTDFLSNLEIISNTTNNNLDVMWSVMECQLDLSSKATFYQVYHYWINLNSVNILNETDEIKYIMFKVDNYIRGLMSAECARFDTFKQNMNNIQNLYKLLTKLIGKKTTNIIDEFVDFNQEKQTINVNVKKTKKDKLIDMTDDEFLDATDGEKTETEVDDKNSEKSDDYNDSDDSDTVFRKATKNTSVRTTKRINKGAKVKTLTK